MSKIVFQAKITLLDASPTTSPLVWGVGIRFADAEGLFTGYDVADGDVLVLDTTGYESGTFTRFVVSNIISLSYDYVRLSVTYDPTNDNNDPNVDLGYVIGYDGMIARPSSHIGLIPIVSSSMQTLSDRFSTYILNYNLHGILDNLLLFTNGGLGNTFTDPNPTPLPLGGIPAGTTFVDTPIAQVLHDLLYPYLAPTFESFRIANQDAILEVGDRILGGAVVFEWTPQNSQNIVPGSLEIRDISSNNVMIVANMVDDGYEVVNITDIRRIASGSQMWKLLARSTDGSTLSSFFVVNWIWRIHFGEISTTQVDETRIKALRTSLLATTAVGQYDFVKGGYKMIACPTLFGPLNSFRDTKTGLDVPMLPSVLATVTNGHGVTTTYSVYRTVNMLGAGIVIEVS